MNVAIKQPSPGGDIRTEDSVEVKARRLVKKRYILFVHYQNVAQTRIAPQNYKQVSELRHNHPQRETSLATRRTICCVISAQHQQVFADRLAAGRDIIFITKTMAQGDKSGFSKMLQVAFTPRKEAGEKVLGTLHMFTKQ